MSRAPAIRRGGSPTLKRPAGTARSRTRRSPRPTMAGRLAQVLPLAESSIRRLGHIALAALLVCALGAAALVMRLPQMIGWELGEAVGRMGFNVERVEIRGIDRMERLPVYAVALDQPSMAMPLIDLAEIRERVETFGWVREARVSRRLPDTLVIAIDERLPTAIWQHEGRLYLIDGEGAVLDRVAIEAMPDLPLIVGPGANRQAAAFADLIETAPTLAPLLDGATWIGGRRWDLRFQSGETLALPEGEEAAAQALVRFARMDGVTGLLGEGFQRFDMRVPDRFVVRVSRDRMRRDAAADSDII